MCFDRAKYVLSALGAQKSIFGSFGAHLVRWEQKIEAIIIAKPLKHLPKAPKCALTVPSADLG